MNSLAMTALGGTVARSSSTHTTPTMTASLTNNTEVTPDYIKQHIAKELLRVPEAYRGLARNVLEFGWKHQEPNLRCALKHADGTEISAKWTSEKAGDHYYFQCSLTIGTVLKSGHVRKQ